MSTPLSLRAGRIALPLAAMIGVLLAGASAGAMANSAPSDPIHAEFHQGNAVSCSQIGLEGSTTLFGDGDNALSGAVTGSVQAQAGGGQESTISATADGVVIDAVVVKGGDGYNVYYPTNNVFPAYPGPYMAPLNGGGNVPAFSHWFVCYHSGDVLPPLPVAPGSPIVQKVIVNPSAVAVSANYSVHVTCDDGTDATRTLPAAGGVAIEGPVTGIEADSLCNVTETSTAGAVPSYSPVNAGPTGTGVTVGSGVEVSVTVTNTFAAAEVIVTPPAPVTNEVPVPNPVVAVGGIVVTAASSPTSIAAQTVTVAPQFTG